MKGELEGRLDPLFYTSVKKIINSSKFELVKTKEVVSSLKSGFGVGKQDQAENHTDGFIQIRPTNLDKDGNLKFNKNVYVPNDIANNDNLLAYGDVLFNNTNSQELVGKTAYYDIKNESHLYSNHITRIRVKEDKIIPKYLQIVLNLYQNKKIFYAICTNWNNQSGVGNELLLNLKIPLPPSRHTAAHRR